MFPMACEVVEKYKSPYFWQGGVSHFSFYFYKRIFTHSILRSTISHTRTRTIMTSPPVTSNGPTAASSSPIDSSHHNVKEPAQDHTHVLQTQRSSVSSGDAQSLGLAPQAVSLHDATQSPDHDEALSDTVSEHNENEWDGPQQTLNSDVLESASQASVDSSRAAVTEETPSMQQQSPTSSPTSNSASAISESLVHDYDEINIILRPSISDSLGLWTCAIIAGGTAVTLGLLGFLIFLWAGEGPAGGESASYVWRTIMLSESWSAQTITISAVVLRTVAAAQAAICTSLVAALLLERRRLPLSKVVTVSIMRGINDGPFNLVRQTLSWKCLQSLWCVEMGLLLLVTVMTFGTQFTSTILLSGFNTTTLVQFSQQLHHNVILSSEAALNASELESFSEFPSSYAVFGELESPETPDPGPGGVSDTGVKFRSFIPFQEQQRLKLRAYRGPAFSLKIQIMCTCMRPNMDARVSWDKVITERGGIPMSLVSGTISYEKTFEEAALKDWALCSSFQRLDGSSQTVCLPQNFTCTLPMRPLLETGPLTVIALCHLPTAVVWNTNQTSQAEHVQMWNDSSPLWSGPANPWVYLTLSTNLTTDAVDNEFTNGNSSIPLVTPIAKAGEWQMYQVLPTMGLNISLCFAGLQTDIYNVTMSTTIDPKEPEIRWDPIYSEDGAESGQVFMGTTGSHLSAAERGILSISDFRHTDGLKAEDINGSSHALWKGPSGFTGMFSDTSGGSYMTCNFCAFAGWPVAPDIAALFTRTVHTTGRTAWAIQSFLTTYTESWYAQILPQFDVSAGIDVTFSTQVRIPRRWEGLIAALVMVIVNLVCVWAITILYIVHTRFSRQGNVWHTVSQILSDDTRLILEQSNRVMDDEVEKRLKVDDYLVFIGRPKGSGNVSVMRC